MTAPLASRCGRERVVVRPPVLGRGAVLLDVVDQAVGHPRDAADVGHRLVDVAVLGVERGVAEERELLVRIGDAALEPAGHPECAANGDEHERQDDLACDFLHCCSPLPG